MLLRCTLDGLLLPAVISDDRTQLITFDGDESFEMEAIEAMYYELVAATEPERLWLEERTFRLLRLADDFVNEDIQPDPCHIEP